jgi:hypothetical protein
MNISGLIRKLLLDDPPLVHRVNRNYRLSLRFEIAESPPLPGNEPPIFYSKQDGFDPTTADPRTPRAMLTLDQFHAFYLGSMMGKSYTVRDVVLFEANVMGSIHAGSPNTDIEHALNILVTLSKSPGERHHSDSYKRLGESF